MTETINAKIPLDVYTEVADGSTHVNGVTIFSANQNVPIEVVITSGATATLPVAPYTLPVTNTPITLRGIPTGLGYPMYISGYQAGDKVQVKPPPGMTAGAGDFMIRIIR